MKYIYNGSNYCSPNNNYNSNQVYFLTYCKVDFLDKKMFFRNGVSEKIEVEYQFIEKFFGKYSSDIHLWLVNLDKNKILMPFRGKNFRYPEEFETEILQRMFEGSVSVLMEDGTIEKFLRSKY